MPSGVQSPFGVINSFPTDGKSAHTWLLLPSSCTRWKSLCPCVGRGRHSVSILKKTRRKKMRQPESLSEIDLAERRINNLQSHPLLNCGRKLLILRSWSFLSDRLLNCVNSSRTPLARDI